MTATRFALGASISFVLLIASATVGSAGTLWWVDAGLDSEWGNLANWVTGGHPHVNAVPDENLDIYITTSGHAALPVLAPLGLASPQADLTSATAGFATGQTIYIGGWKEEQDADHDAGETFSIGDAEGTLRMTAGTLNTAAVPGGSPPCRYIRAGYRGARGTLDQSGGQIDICTTLTLGWWGATSLGIYDLSGGVFRGLGVDVGGQGVGFFNLDGGDVEQGSLCTGPNPEAVCVSYVGRGYFDESTGYLPGVGVVSHREGTFGGDVLSIGTERGSVGAVYVSEKKLKSGTTQLHPTDALEIGWSGVGSVIQTGGSVRTGEILLGTNLGGVGQYTISGGTLEQTASGRGFRNGAEGLGRLAIVGAESTIDVKKYEQAPGAILTLIIDDDYAENPTLITPIRADDTYGLVQFEKGSIIEVAYEDRENGAAPAGLTEGQPFLVAKATGIFPQLRIWDPDLQDPNDPNRPIGWPSTDESLVDFSSPDGKWMLDFDFDEDELWLIYCGANCP